MSFSVADPSSFAAHSPVCTDASTPRKYNVTSPSRTGNVETWPLAGSLTQGVQGAHVKRSDREHGSVSHQRLSKIAYVIFQGREVGIFDSWYVLRLLGY